MCNGHWYLLTNFSYLVNKILPPTSYYGGRQQYDLPGYNNQVLAVLACWVVVV